MRPKVTPNRLDITDTIITLCLAILTIAALAYHTNISALPAAIASLAFITIFSLYTWVRRRPMHRLTRGDSSLREQARLADGFAEALIIINRHQNVLYANPAAQSLFNIGKSGNSVSSIIHDPNVRKLVSDTLAGKHSDPVTLHLDTPVERHIRVMASAIFSRHDTGEIRRAIIVFYDITDLVRVDTMRADFLANASHELKTPVASLLGYIETLRGHAKDDPQAQETFLGIMQEQAERMQRLIDDLLSLRRIEIVEHIVPTETADLFLATRAAIEAVKPIAKKRGVKVKYNGPKEALVTGSQDELVQLVLNILDNAVMITPEDASVKLDLSIAAHWDPDLTFSGHPDFTKAAQRQIVMPTRPDAPHVILRIYDQGPGFPREHLPRLGERFYKISPSGPNGKRGTGLGLAIVKHIMRRHRGGLFIESAEGAGTIFTIALPLNREIITKDG